MAILITGAGLVGTHTAQRLLARGAQPVLYDLAPAADYVRSILGDAAVPVVRARSHLPVLVDPSHGTGFAAYVPAMARAACAAGADGVMVEVHVRPQEARSDAVQALRPEEFADLAIDLRLLWRALAPADVAEDGTRASPPGL